MDTSLSLSPPFLQHLNKQSLKIRRRGSQENAGTGPFAPCLVHAGHLLCLPNVSEAPQAGPNERSRESGCSRHPPVFITLEESPLGMRHAELAGQFGISAFRYAFHVFCILLTSSGHKYCLLLLVGCACVTTAIQSKDRP